MRAASSRDRFRASPVPRAASVASETMITALCARSALCPPRDSKVCKVSRAASARSLDTHSWQNAEVVSTRYVADDILRIALRPTKPTAVKPGEHVKGQVWIDGKE